MAYVYNALLDLDTTDTRGESFRFDLTDITGAVIGELHPATGCKIANSTSQQIKRKLSSFKITPDEYAYVNPLTDRVRPYMVLSDGTEWPMGVFMFADVSTVRYSYGLEMQCSLVDQGLILCQKISTNVAFDAGTTATEAIISVMEMAGFYDAVVAESTFTFGSPIAYPAGKSGTTYAKILDDITKKAGYYSPYFDNEGVPTVSMANTSISSTWADLVYEDGGRIASGSMTESNDMLTAPNSFLVIDTSATTGDVSYSFAIPADAPHSYENRGFWITETIEVPGVGNVEQAAAVASAYFAMTTQSYETVKFSSPTDPRHDTFDVIKYRGNTYLETEWSISCEVGLPMTHTAVRSYR